jgi:BirA family biotin operon repressor/biotin-[acetyl-CoA-carboxylase] ligase
MAFTLSRRAEAAGYRITSFDTIGSTSDEGAARARAGERGPLWLVSRHQSAGRGRRGSVFHSPDGNLAASLLLSTELPPRTVATLGFVAGLALGRALERCCGGRLRTGLGVDAGRPSEGGEFRLKWPNDVLVDGAKLSGIALETEERAGLPRWVIVGIGVNVVAAPTGLSYPAAALAGLGFEVTAEVLFEALADEWVDACAIWDEGRGFAEIRRLWLARAFGLGGDIVVRMASSVTRGRFESLDEAGQLVLRLHDGTCRAVSAGEIHFGMTARAAATGPAETDI